MVAAAHLPRGARGVADPSLGKRRQNEEVHDGAVLLQRPPDAANVPAAHEIEPRAHVIAARTFEQCRERRFAADRRPQLSEGVTPAQATPRTHVVVRGDGALDGVPLLAGRLRSQHQVEIATLEVDDVDALRAGRSRGNIGGSEGARDGRHQCEGGNDAHGPTPAHHLRLRT